jgi:hypothetical protein
MRVTVVPLSDFIHGGINAHEGHAIQMDSGVASDLERAGLVRIRQESVAHSASGKEQDDGLGRPSSASQAAQVVPPQTVGTLKRGPGRPRKTDASS